jgi:lycopene cyclase domain-containing protein
VHVVYVAILAGCVIGTLPLETVLHARVYARWPRALVTLVPVVVLFGAWDVLEIRAGAWTYDPRYLVGVTLPGRLPLEELLFFVVVPLCALLTFEAVAHVRPDWAIDTVPDGGGKP